MILEFQVVQRDEARASFQEYRGLIQEVLDKTDSKFLPEDVFTEISQHMAFLYRIVDSETGALFGITIVRLDVEKHTDRRIVLAYIQNVDFWDDAEVSGQIISFYDDLARKVGAKHVQFVTPRIGWTKKKMGCKLVACIFEREVPNG